MTESEAIELLKHILYVSDHSDECNNVEIDGLYQEALDVAIKALEEIQTYRDAEEQGLLLRLPYPFGTKLYYVIDDFDYGMSVNEVIFDLEFVSDVLRYPNEYYLTREEAEQALKQMGE